MYKRQVGVDSPDDLTKSKLGEYGEMQHGWTAEDAKGCIKEVYKRQT